MKKIKSFLLLFWLFLPTIFLLVSCTSEYQVTANEFSKECNYSLVKVKLKSGSEYACDSKYNSSINNEKLKCKLPSGEIKEFNLDNVESLVIDKFSLYKTSGLVVLGIGIIAFGFFIWYISKNAGSTL